MEHAINRFELKYVVHARQARAFEAALGPFLRPDPHADGRGFYRVTSLYYDTPGLACWRAKVDGLKVRRKLRLRVYPDAAGVPDAGMVEIKQRIDRTVQKRRVKLGLEAAKDLCAGGAVPDGLDEEERRIAEEVRGLSLGGLVPACVVTYLRRAWVGSRVDPSVRVTLDADLAARVHALDPAAEAANHRFLPPDLCILEVKVDEGVPRWLASLLAAHDFALRRVSKYCLGLETAMRTRITERRA
jgi:hypothetical protein